MRRGYGFRSGKNSGDLMTIVFGSLRNWWKCPQRASAYVKTRVLKEFFSPILDVRRDIILVTYLPLILASATSSNGLGPVFKF